MGALDTVASYITSARTFLQDTVEEYRYPDADLIEGLNFAMLEARRLRPDLFIGRSVPSFSTNDTTAVVMDEQYRVPFVYYMVGHVQLRDEEDTQDARASALLNKFVSQMLNLAS